MPDERNHHRSHSSRSRRLNSQSRVLKDQAVIRFHAKLFRSHKKRIRRWFGVLVVLSRNDNRELVEQPKCSQREDHRLAAAPFAVVSGSSRESVVFSLTTLGLLDKFPIIVAAEDYKNPKPAPDAFLMAAEKLGMEPNDCLVFEDTALGIQAATAAGMASVMVPFIRHRS